MIPNSLPELWIGQNCTWGKRWLYEDPLNQFMLNQFRTRIITEFIDQHSFVGNRLIIDPENHELLICTHLDYRRWHVLHSKWSRYRTGSTSVEWTLQLYNQVQLEVQRQFSPPGSLYHTFVKVWYGPKCARVSFKTLTKVWYDNNIIAFLTAGFQKEIL
jgi:hypothetical protein